MLGLQPFLPAEASYAGYKKKPEAQPVHPRCPRDPFQVSQVAEGLLDYLAHTKGIPKPQYMGSPKPVPNGWETHTFHCQLRRSAGLTGKWAEPLTLRIYASPQGLPRLRHEFAVQRHLHERGFPVPKPVLLEESSSFFGGPFLLMEQISGETLFDFLGWQPLWMWPVAARMAELQARLHRLSADEFPTDGKPFLDRRLNEIDGLIRAHRLLGLRPGLDWLRSHRPPPPRSLSILHLDYHPLNLIRKQDRSLFVIDWPEGDVGDFHADLGTSLMLMECCPVGGSTWFDQVAVPIGRSLLRMWYGLEYKIRVPVDERKLAYYRALAALRRLAGYGRWLTAGPLATGCKPTSLRYLCPHHLKKLQAYFRKWSGVGVKLTGTDWGVPGR